MIRITLFLVILLSGAALAQEPVEPEGDDEDTVGEESNRADIRDDDVPLKLQKGDFVIIPVPFSNPTIDSGLIGAAAYFHPQTDEQKAVQPASVTAVAAMYSSNDSFAYGIGHQQYWDEDRWRFSGALGRADLNLTLRGQDETGTEQQASWLLDGSFLYAYFSRAFYTDWYVGISARYIDMNQKIIFDDPLLGEEETATTSSGLGITFEFDSRDMPFNSYDGNLFQLKTLFNSTVLGSDTNYESFDGAFRSYRMVSKTLVFAWEVEACKRSGDVPLWDSCRVDLRGFPATDYLGKGSANGQAEIRWKASPRWGFVGFAGAGYITDTQPQSKEKELIPSYGAGVRFMVLKAKRINLRLDYARSSDSDAIYVGVTEAF